MERLTRRTSAFEKPSSAGVSCVVRQAGDGTGVARWAKEAVLHLPALHHRDD